MGFLKGRVRTLPFGRPREVILVDENDCEIGHVEKLSAHFNNQLHRAFSIFIFRRYGSKIEVLLQQRNKLKYHSGGLWSNTCCGHPQPGEEILSAGKRRLLEEMGFTADLKDIGHFYYQAELQKGLSEHEIDHVLIGTSDFWNLFFDGTLRSPSFLC